MHFWESSGNMILQALGWTVIHALWQGAVIATLLAIVFALLPRKSAVIRYKLAYAGMLGMVIWSVWTFGSELDQPDQFKLIYENHLLHETTTITFEGINPLNSGWIASLKAQVTDYIPWVACIWVLGALFFSLRWFGSFLYLRQLRNTAYTLHHPLWQKKTDRLAAYFGFGRKVYLMVSERIQSPMVIGHLKPVILLPIGFLTALAPSQVESILVHELAHIRRNDFLLNMLQQLLEILFFYHPAYWWLSQVLQDEREHCCDDIAISYSGDPLAYARALTELEQHRLDHGKLAIGIQGRNNHMLGRIKRIMGVKQQNVNMNTRLVTFLIMSISLCGLAWMAPAHLPETGPLDISANTALAPLAYIAGVDSPPPPPPPPPSLPPLPPPPPPPSGSFESMPTPPAPPAPPAMRKGGSVPDYLNPDEVEGYVWDEDEMRQYKESMAQFELQMEKWGEEFGEKYGKQMEAYGKEMEKWQAEYEASMGEDFQKDMEKFAKDMEKWGEEFGKDYGEQFERIARDIERAQHEQERVRDRDRLREDRAHLDEQIARELAEKLRALEKMEHEDLRAHEEKMRAAREELRRVEESQRRKAESLHRAQEAEFREAERQRREVEMKLREQEVKMREQEARLRAEESRLRDSERALRLEEQRMSERYEVLKKELYRDGMISSTNSRTKIQIDEDGMTINGKKVSKSLEDKYLRMIGVEGRPEKDSRINIQFD